MIKIHDGKALHTLFNMNNELNLHQLSLVSALSLRFYAVTWTPSKDPERRMPNWENTIAINGK